MNKIIVITVKIMPPKFLRRKFQYHAFALLPFSDALAILAGDTEGSLSLKKLWLKYSQSTSLGPALTGKPLF